MSLDASKTASETSKTLPDGTPETKNVEKNYRFSYDFPEFSFFRPWGSKRVPDGPKTAVDGSKRGEGGPRWAHEGSQRAQDGP